MARFTVRSTLPELIFRLVVFGQYVGPALLNQPTVESSTNESMNNLTNATDSNGILFSNVDLMNEQSQIANKVSSPESTLNESQPFQMHSQAASRHANSTVPEIANVSVTLPAMENTSLQTLINDSTPLPDVRSPGHVSTKESLSLRTTDSPPITHTGATTPAAHMTSQDSRLIYQSFNVSGFSNVHVTATEGSTSIKYQTSSVSAGDKVYMVWQDDTTTQASLHTRIDPTLDALRDTNEHNSHTLTLQNKHYIQSVVVPVACGIIGALALVCVAYALRSCPSRNFYFNEDNNFKSEEPVCVSDQLMLLVDSSDEEV